MTTIDIDAALDDILDNEAATEGHDDQAKPDPYIAALPVDQLFADHTYQRELDEHRVQKMAAAYKIALVGIIEVSQRTDDTYAILDGQHRWATVRDVHFLSPITQHLACRVHVGLTIAEEAALYHQLNTTRRQLTGWDRWLARRGAGDPLVAQIEDLAAQHGFTVGMREAPGVLRATKAAENVVALGAIALLDQVLGVVRAAYGDDQAGLDAAIVYGLGHVLHAYGRDELDTNRLVEVLAGIVPRQLTARAAAVREIHKGTNDRLTAHVIVERYNASKGPKLQPFLERVKPASKSKPDAAARRNLAIREWAERQGTPVATQRIPKSVRIAYDSAHPGSTA